MEARTGCDGIGAMNVFLFVVLATILEATGDAIVRIALQETGGLIVSVWK